MQTFIRAPFPDNEEQRLAALADYALLDTGGEEVFDALARLAAGLCETPIAVIGLVDRDRFWLKSNIGMEALTETARDATPSAYAILHNGIMEVPDALLDERFMNSPNVSGYPHMRFYAGAPLTVATGDTLGTLSVMDREPRRLSPDQREMLQTVAGAIVEQFEHRRAYLRLFDRSPAELYEIDAATERLRFVSDGACRNMGYGLAELRGMSLAEVFPLLKVAVSFSEYATRSVAAHRSQGPIRTSVRRKDGSTYIIDLRLEPIVTASANVVLGLGVEASADVVSEEREATVAVPASDAGSGVALAGTSPLELQNERLTTLTAVARNVFASLDPRSLVGALIRGVSELTGGGTAQLLARGAGGEFTQTRDLASRADAAVPDDGFLRAAATHDGVLLGDDGLRAAVQILAPSGIVAYVLDIRAAGRPFVATDSFAFGLLGQYLAVAIHNVELYGELESRRAAVIELNQVKNDLIAMLAHDFKGPLTTIVGLADVLAEDERFDAESRQFLGMINSSAMRLASLATDTLALSRLEQNELSLRFEAVDVVALLRDIVRVFSVTRGIDIRCPAHELVVRADPARLRQVFENLIGNAIKYSPRGDTVDVTLREKRGAVEVAIRDRGIGIPARDVPKLFGRFARGSNARKMGIRGTGFGLYLSRTIIERHGGQIAIESKEGSGSTFRVLVPATPPPQRTRDRRILLLDNEDDARSFIAHTLRDEGYAVYAVVNDAELLRTLDDGRYDAAVIDVDRLAITSAELVASVARRTMLVRLVSSAEPDTPGWDATLRKPFLIKDLQVVLEAVVAERRRGPRRTSSDRLSG